MNRLINFIGTVVLCGILLKLSYVFVYLFGELDSGSLMSRVTGVTFAFASIYFVVKLRRNWLKIVMVILDVCTILYFYLHERMRIPVDFASVIVAAYSGLIIYYLGRTVSDRLAIDAQSTADRLRELENRQRIDVERRELETEVARCRRRIRQSRSDETRRLHEQRLAELEGKLKQLII
jgi:ABC-type multidrug transport system fused ATPase/permease subunit